MYPKIDKHTQHVISNDFKLLSFFRLPIFITFDLNPSVSLFFSFSDRLFISRSKFGGVNVCMSKISIHQLCCKPKPKSLWWKKYFIGCRARVSEWHNSNISKRQTHCRHYNNWCIFASFPSHHHHLSISVLRIFVFSRRYYRNRILPQPAERGEENEYRPNFHWFLFPLSLS